MDILKEVKDSVLWLYSENEFAKNNLVKEADKHGVKKDRIIFASRMPKAEHLARHRCADLFLDCFTVNAHTTAIDALYAGLPLVTKAGNDIMSRASASILTSCDMQELITDSEKDFKKLAIKLANDKKKLESINKKLSKNVKNSALFNNKKYVKDFEEKLIQVVS